VLFLGQQFRRIAERDWRDEGGFEVRSPRFSERRTPDFELWISPFAHVSRFTRRALWLPADLFSILLASPHTNLLAEKEKT
jgi:hypothetical protein